MRVAYVLNNYTLGAKLKSAPTHKITERERLDKGHTKVVFDLTEREVEFCNRLFAKKGVASGEE